MSENPGGGFLDASTDPREDVVADIGRKAGEISSMGYQLMTMQAYGSAGRSQQLESMAKDGRQDTMERILALRERDEPVMRQAWDDGWWDRAGSGEIGRVWETTCGWAANGDPLAMRTEAWMREQFRDRYGLELPATPVSGRLAGEALAGGDAGPPSPPGRTVTYVIRDKRNAGENVKHGIFSLDHDDHRRLDFVAADRLVRYRADHGHGRPDGRLEIVAHDGTSTFTLSDKQATDLTTWYDTWTRHALENPTQVPREQLRDVLHRERMRLRDERDRLLADDPREEAPGQAGAADGRM
jgi:hypothetical protein